MDKQPPSRGASQQGCVCQVLGKEALANIHNKFSGFSGGLEDAVASCQLQHP